jgi:hypothetical protein
MKVLEVDAPAAQAVRINVDTLNWLLTANDNRYGNDNHSHKGVKRAVASTSAQRF